MGSRGICWISAWQNRPLEPTYAVVYFDALRVKIRDEGLVRNKAVYLAFAKAQLAIQFGIRFTMHKARPGRLRPADTCDPATFPP